MISSFVAFLHFLTLFTCTFCNCNWGSWSSDAECEWIDNHCLNGYRRNCICDDKISDGSACHGSKTNFIQAKPFVSNFYSLKKNCDKRNCPMHSNWCEWSDWSYWHPSSNVTCHRHRSRKCCLSQPQIGYTTKKVPNLGCFLSRSEQSSVQIGEEISNMQCSSHTWWLKKVLYGGIAVCGVILLCLICKCTGSKSNDRVTYPVKIIEISPTDETVEIEPSAPTLQLPNQEPPPRTQSPVRIVNTTNYPSTPPTYDETIRSILATSDAVNEISDHPTANEKKSVPDDNEIVTPRIEEVRSGNFDNISPPSYTIYSRNPNLFTPTI